MKTKQCDEVSKHVPLKAADAADMIHYQEIADNFNAHREETMKRKTPAQLSKELWRLASDVERKAVALRELGLDRWANGLNSAANELSAAAEKVRETYQ